MEFLTKGEEGLSFVEQPVEECGQGQVLVRNRCVSLNFPDVLITRGKYQMKPDLPFVPGSELAGEILSVGEGIEGFEPGQRVLALTGFGAFAERVVVSPGFHQLHAIPDSMSFDDAASLNMTYGTAIHGLKQRGQLRSGETCLVLGASGGCGSAAIQVAKAMGANVIGAASSEEKCNRVMQAGADHAINYGRSDLREQVATITGGKGVDIVFDPVGDKLFKPALRSLAWNGRYLVIGFAGGEIPQVGINYTLIKSISIVGVAYGMSAMQDPKMNNGNFQQLFEWYEKGLIKPMIGKTYNNSEMPKALAELYAGNAAGKTIVRFD